MPKFYCSLLNIFSPTLELKFSPPYHGLMNNVNEDQANV